MKFLLEDLLRNLLFLFQDRSFFTKAHGKFGTQDNATSLRLLYYPFNKNLKAGQVRLGQHTDYGTITLLFQNQVGGLEVGLRCSIYIPFSGGRFQILKFTIVRFREPTMSMGGKYAYLLNYSLTPLIPS